MMKRFVVEEFEFCHSNQAECGTMWSLTLTESVLLHLVSETIE